ncbi:odorant receptor 46a-like [Hylaeus volcanicus]|uniref:odorant receptor 46a-like n=1 Tax=Hylaeus volcanicus TaxID=313075 RepID=UPI0023B85154|nr:odorant receptor 46a-like [Hylaeus volcanicus]
MRLMRWIFRILVVCGCWRPSSWTTPLKMFLYTVYRTVILLLVYTVTFLQFMDIVLNVRNQDEFSDNFYMLLAMIVSCHKLYSLLKSRDSIRALISILEKEPFLPGNAEEIGIRTRFDKRAESITLLYAGLVEVTVLSISCAALLTSDNIELPYRMWLPCNCSSTYSMSLTYTQQVLALTAGSLLHVACDGLICGLLTHTYSQMEILGCRLKTIKRGENEFASMINTEFRMVIFVQFAVSTLEVCFNLYLLTTMKSANAQYVKIILYTSSMLTQIFVYCWHGDEVKSKSLDISNMIFRTDWTFLDKNAKRVLLMIMRRASVPIEFTSMHIAHMNLETFVSVSIHNFSSRKE